MGYMICVLIFNAVFQPTAAKKPKKQQHIKAKGQKKKKISLKFTVDCTHPVEDNIMDVASFVSLTAVWWQFLCKSNCISGVDDLNEFMVRVL